MSDSKKFFAACFVSVVGLLLLTGSVFGQVGASDVGIKPALAGGEVLSVEADRIVVRTKDGDISALISGTTEFKKVSPTNPSLKTAEATDASALGVGDKVLVTGAVSSDRKTVPAKAVYLITKSSIAERDKKESEDWRRRGIAGKVVSLNPQTGAVTVSVRGLMGERNVTVTPGKAAEYFRYSQDSVRFSDSKKSSFAEIETGDSIRVLGDRNADGSEMVAEKLVTGAFRTVVGNITAIDAASGVVTVTDLQSKKPVTISIPAMATLQQFPPEMAQRFAMFSGGGTAGGMGGSGGGFRPPQSSGTGATQQPQQGSGAPQGAGMAQGAGMRMGGGPGMDDILERLPKISLADLKVGEMIAVSSTKTEDVSRIRAIKLVSGIEPLVRAQQQAGARPGSRGADSGFTIPGLDGGFGIP